LTHASLHIIHMESTQYSPFELMFRRKAMLPIDIEVVKKELLDEYNMIIQLTKLKNNIKRCSKQLRIISLKHR